MAEGHGQEKIRAIAGTLMYQSEGHADRARMMVEQLDEQKTIPARPKLDTIPLPPELQQEHYTNNVVAFTLFDTEGHSGLQS